MTTAAVLTRVQLIEGPYLNEFIAWYLGLGFSTIYFIHTEPANALKPWTWNSLATLKRWIDPALLAHVRFHPHAGKVDAFPYARRVLSSVVSEDYVLHVDCDELLVLPKRYRNVTELIDQNPAALHVFHWFCVPVKKLFQLSMLDYLREEGAAYKNADARKMMVNRGAWRDDPDAEMHPHRFVCRGKVVDYKDDGSGDNPFVLHFIVRGYVYTLLRLLHQRFKNDKSNLGQFLRGVVKPSEYPERFSLALGECYSAQNPIPIGQWNIPSITTPRLDTERVSAFVTQSLGKLAVSGVDYTREDPYALAAKMEHGLSELRRAQCPVTENSGFKYNRIIKEALATIDA